jgi:hypothetical protein
MATKPTRARSTQASRDEDAPDRRRLWILLALAGLLVIPLAIIWWPRFRKYPPVTSRESLQLMKLLYAACNTRDLARLSRVEQGVEELKREGKLAAAEQGAFESIIATARSGDWEAAEQAGFKFAEDQVGVGHPAAPHDHGHDHAHGHSHPR